MKNSNFQTRESLFTFLFCSLCPIAEPSQHSHEHNFFVWVSFYMPLVRACCPTSTECPSMFWALPLSSFFVFCPKGSCFPLPHCSCRPTRLYLHLPIIVCCSSSFGKRHLGSPPLFHFVLGCSDLRFRRCPLFYFSILCILIFNLLQYVETFNSAPDSFLCAVELPTPSQ